MQGGIGVLLRIDNPYEDVGQRYQPVHLQGMLSGHRVVVGHVEQDQPRHAPLVLGVKNGVSPDTPLRGDPKEVQERAGVVAPGAGGRSRRRGPPRTDISKVQLGQGVEQGGLTRASATE